MTIVSQLIASGTGWRAENIVCSAGPQDRPFEERHDTVCIAVVLEGSFQYRSSRGAALLAPGDLLLGEVGQCFECGHEHAAGDRCLSFHFAPAYFEAVIAGVPGVRRMSFDRPRLTPRAALVSLVAEVEAAGGDGDGEALEELALRLAGASAAIGESAPAARAPSRREERWVTDALRQIEAQAHEPLALADLAREASMSPYHFLRTFRSLVGMTPHQFVLRTRLHRAAVRLRRTGDSVSTIAFEAGFNDLSTFNRRFRRMMGASPTVYRCQRQASR